MDSQSTLVSCHHHERNFELVTVLQQEKLVPLSREHWGVVVDVHQVDEELHHVGVPLPLPVPHLPRQMVSLPLLPVQSEAPGRQTDHPSLVVHFFI